MILEIPKGGKRIWSFQDGTEGICRSVCFQQDHLCGGEVAESLPRCEVWWLGNALTWPSGPVPPRIPFSCIFPVWTSRNILSWELSPASIGWPFLLNLHHEIMEGRHWHGLYRVSSSNWVLTLVRHKSHLGRFLAAQTPQCTSEVFGSVGLSPGHLRFTSSLGGFDGQPSESASHRESGLVAPSVVLGLGASVSSPGVSLDMPLPGVRPGPRLCGWGPEFCGLTSPPGDSEAY